MPKFDVSVFLNNLIQSISFHFYSTRLKRMATVASLLAGVAALTVLCLLVQSGESSPDDGDVQRVHRSLLGVPSQSLVSRFSLPQAPVQNQVSTS
jgi:hypothetical protein